MAIAWDFVSTNLRDLTNWTLVNSPPVASDQHGTDNTSDLNGSSQFEEKNSSPTEFFTSGTTGVIQQWVITTDTGTGGRLSSERATNENGIDVAISNGQIIVTLQSSPGNALRSSSNVSTLYNDGLWHLITIVINGTGSLDIYVDGSEVSYDMHDFVFNTGWTGHVTDNKAFRVGFGGGSGQYLDCIPSRIKLKLASVTAGEVATEYLEELAAIPEDSVIGSSLFLNDGLYSDNLYPDQLFSDKFYP